MALSVVVVIVMALCCAPMGKVPMLMRPASIASECISVNAGDSKISRDV
jgi:hypothetical protein